MWRKESGLLVSAIRSLEIKLKTLTDIVGKCQSVVASALRDADTVLTPHCLFCLLSCSYYSRSQWSSG